MAKHIKLGELPSTAICGNDISSSCLYVSALSIGMAGQYAWISLLMVAGVLFFFRKIYGEVVGALPLNGGAYNALLNTTSKFVASIAACLTLLSYTATAVISAGEAMHYAHSMWHGLPVFWATVVLLAIFMVLTIIGIGESSVVAIGIFIFHLTSLLLLSAFCIVFIINNGVDILLDNFSRPTEGGIVKALFFGFCAAMLGISGFESSANFVEEQERGVFPKTLKNMWIVVSVFNPLMAFLALSIVSIPDVAVNQEALLSHMGDKAGGNWLSYWISVDATLVLSGAVLTSFVGVGGLVERMTLDRIMPSFLLKKTKKGSPYMIMIAFFLLSFSIHAITKGDILALAGVYTISFLSVMFLFAVGNILLKVKRSKLPRPEKASPWALIIAVVAVVAAIAGNIKMHPKYFGVFIEYFIPTMLIAVIMLNRTSILKVFLNLVRYFTNPITSRKTNRRISRVIDKINSQEFVFFAKGENVASLNKVMQYIEHNEHTRKLKIVTVLDEGVEVPANLHTDIEVLDRAYPEIDIEFLCIKGKFGPKLINKLSGDWNIPVNFMFIGSPGDRFPYRIEQLGGVRLII